MHVWATVDLCHGVGGGGEDQVEGQLQEQGLPRCRGCPHPLCHCHRHHLSLWGICEYIGEWRYHEWLQTYIFCHLQTSSWMTLMPLHQVLVHTPIYAGIWTSLFFVSSGIITIAGDIVLISISVSLSALPLSPPDLTNRQIFIIFWLLTSRFTRWSEDFSCNSGRLNSLSHQRCHSLCYCIRPC